MRARLPAACPAYSDTKSGTLGALHAAPAPRRSRACAPRRAPPCTARTHAPTTRSLSLSISLSAKLSTYSLSCFIISHPDNGTRPHARARARPRGPAPRACLRYRAPSRGSLRGKVEQVSRSAGAALGQPAAHAPGPEADGSQDHDAAHGRTATERHTTRARGLARPSKRRQHHLQCAHVNLCGCPNLRSPSSPLGAERHGYGVT